MLRPPISSEHQPIPDCWVTLSFIAGETSRVTIGSLVSSVLFRSPEYLTRICSSLSEVGGNRLVVGLGSGWYDDEFASYGIEFPTPKARIHEVERAITAIRGSAAELGDKGKQERQIPRIWVGGSGERFTLPLVAKMANGCSLQGNSSTITQKIGVLKSFCRNYSRDINEITISKQSNIIIDSSREKINSKLRSIIPDETKWKSFAQNNIVGTPDECVAQIVQLSNLGISYFTLNFPDLFDLESIRMFAKEVVGQLEIPEYAA